MANNKYWTEKVTENLQLREFVERCMSKIFYQCQYTATMAEDICDDMGITVDEMYQMFNELGYERDEMEEEEEELWDY